MKQNKIGHRSLALIEYYRRHILILSFIVRETAVCSKAVLLVKATAAALAI